MAAKRRSLVTARSKRAGSLAFQLSTQGQDAERIQALVKRALGLVGCDGCGRIAYLKLDLLSDPPVDLGRLGVTGVDARF